MAQKIFRRLARIPGAIALTALAGLLVGGAPYAPYSTLLPPLHDAAAHGRLEEVRQIVMADPGAIRLADDDGNNALHHAAWNGWLPVASLLLDSGAAVDIPRNKPGDGQHLWSPLHHATSNNQTEMIKLLLSRGARVDHRADDGAIPLHHAAWNGNLEATKLLLDARSDVNARRKNGVTPLESAAFFGHTPVVRLLLARGANPSARVYEGYTPLHQAARTNQIEVLRALAEASADLEALKEGEKTPLHVAAENGQTESVAYLLALGAQPLAKDKNGETPLALAQRVGHGGTAAFLTGYLAQRNDLQSEQEARNASNQSLPAGPYLDTPVYKSDFSRETVGDEWSTTPVGAHFADLRQSPLPGTRRHFLGDFGAQNVRLRLAKLPAHRRVTVTLDLLILNTWDGDDLRGGGPDVWEASVTGGPLLLRTTFANTAPEHKTPIQAFPGEYTEAHHPGRQGALASNTLPLPSASAPLNSIYRLKFTFAHNQPYLILNFTGRNLQAVSDESWGISRIEVKVGQPTAGKKARN